MKLLLEVYEHYNEILMKTCKDSFRQLFEVDSYHPMQVDTEEEYRYLIFLRLFVRINEKCVHV